MIRRMEDGDLVQVETLERETFNSGSKESLMSTNSSGNYIYLVKEENHRVVGYISLLVVGDDAEVIQIMVLKEFRGRGYGRELLVAGEEECKKLLKTGIILEVRRSNTVARKLYKSEGYNEISVRKNYYDGTEDAIIMKKEF